MKALLLLPFVAVALLVLIPFVLLLFILGAALFGPILATAEIAQLPAKFYDYAKK